MYPNSTLPGRKREFSIHCRLSSFGTVSLSYQGMVGTGPSPNPRSQMLANGLRCEQAFSGMAVRRTVLTLFHTAGDTSHPAPPHTFRSGAGPDGLASPDSQERELSQLGMHVLPDLGCYAQDHPVQTCMLGILPGCVGTGRYFGDSGDTRRSSRS